MQTKPFRIGTRGSPLALAQTRMTRAALARLGHIVETKDDGELHGEFASPACVGRNPLGVRCNSRAPARSSSAASRRHGAPPA